jgi:hypothetical protein
MALTDTELTACAEIVGEIYSAVYYNQGFLTAAEIVSIQADIVTWNACRDSHLRIKGGSEGVDLDNDRKRAAIRRRVRLKFRFPDTDNSVQMVRG